MVDFGKVLTAMVTPFKDDGSVNYDLAAKLAAYLADNGTETLVVCGTTGESPSLSWDEEYQLFTTVLSAVSQKAQVIAGCGSNSTTEAINATQKAAKIGVHGSLQVVPYYNKPPQAGLLAHFKAIAQAAPDLPLMLYNVPGRTGQNLHPQTIASLSAVENIVALKESTGDIHRVSEIQRLTAKEFHIYSGDDYMTLPLLAMGAKGVVSVASHLVGNQIQQMIEFFLTGKVEAATEIHLQLYPLFQALFATTNPIPIKAALRMVGWEVGSTRLPLCEADSEISQTLKTAIDKLNLTQTNPC